jgi:hypothetical protein
MLLRNSQPQTMPGMVTVACEQQHLFLPGFVLSPLKNLAVVGGAEQALRVSETLGHGVRPRGSRVLDEIVESGSEALATFGTTACDNSPSAFGGHARTKAMGALTLEYAGLECSFHDDYSLWLFSVSDTLVFCSCSGRCLAAEALSCDSSRLAVCLSFCLLFCVPVPSSFSTAFNF